MQAIQFDEYGDESVLRWAEADDPRPDAGQVTLAVASTSVNRADLLQRQGFYPPPPGASEILGLEAAGTIVEIGEGVESWSVGDEAMALLAGGGYAERVVADARHLMPIPAAVDTRDAGAVPEVFLTAYLNLVELGGLESGHRVLVHGGSGGVGTAAIQLARHFGAEVWATAGGAERVARCVELGAHYGIDHREGDFVAGLKAAGGADLVLDIVGAKYLSSNLESLSKGGRLIIIGLQGGVKADINLGLMLGRRLTIVGSTLRGRSDDDKAGIISRFRGSIWPLLDDGTLKPIVDRRMRLADAADAHRHMATGQPFGKIVLQA